MKLIRRLFFRVFKRYRRLELRTVGYAEADKLIRESAGKPECDRWDIAPEEDGNWAIGVVYLERKVRITA